MKRLVIFIVWIAGSGAALAAAPAGNGPGGKGAAPPATAPGDAKPNQIGLVRVDVAKRQISFDAEVCLREGFVEFLMVGWNTKTHEAPLHSKAQASHIHAGLLLLGLHPGRPARWSGREFLPPAGPGLTISLSWKDNDGKVQTADATTWLRAGDRKKLKLPSEWIFVGSRVLPDNRYWAEVTGEVISVTNFASAVIDIPIESSKDDAERDLFANTAAIPPKGKAVTVTISVRPGADKCPHARSMLEIDNTGGLRIDGERIALDKLADWAEAFRAKHDQATMDIRAAGDALVHDLEAVTLQLRLGGIRDVDVEHLTVPDGPLPRTGLHAKDELKGWDEKFANPKDYIEDPAVGAARQLERVDLRLRELDRQKELLKEYADRLRTMRDRYKAATQPAKDK